MLAVLCALPMRASAQVCPAAPLTVQILGSGGPLPSPERASSSYLVWVDGRARVLVDVGGGSFLRFGQARARLDDLALVAITHLHPDHVSDLPALLWLSETARKDRLAVAGPSGNDIVPGFPAFLQRLFDSKTGAFQLLGATLGGPGRGVPLDVTVVDVAKPDPSIVYTGQGLTVWAVGVPHGDIPALGYRIQVGNSSVVFSSDQTGTDPRFVDLARGARVLVMHMAIGAGETSPMHASPEVVGRVAQEARVGRLVLSHLGPGMARAGGAVRAGFDLGPAVAAVRKSYSGPLIVGEDLQCTPVTE